MPAAPRHRMRAVSTRSTSRSDGSSFPPFEDALLSVSADPLRCLWRLLDGLQSEKAPRVALQEKVARFVVEAEPVEARQDCEGESIGQFVPNSTRVRPGPRMKSTSSGGSRWTA